MNVRSLNISMIVRVQEKQGADVHVDMIQLRFLVSSEKDIAHPMGDPLVLMSRNDQVRDAAGTACKCKQIRSVRGSPDETCFRILSVLSFSADFRNWVYYAYYDEQSLALLMIERERGCSRSLVDHWFSSTHHQQLLFYVISYCKV